MGLKKLMRRALYTLVFTIYFLIFYCMLFYGLEFLAPEMLVVPSNVTGEHVAIVIGVLTILTFLSFIGTNCVVHGKASGRRLDE